MRENRRAFFYIYDGIHGLIFLANELIENCDECSLRLILYFYAALLEGDS